MNRPIFERSDFTLCEVPVPKGYPQSQTHVGIAVSGGKYYMTTSPFPNIKYGKWENYFRVIIRKLTKGRLMNPKRADFFENPCLYRACDNQGEVPSMFRLLCQHPLMECPDDYYGFPAYNSDPDLFIEDDTVYILNRSVFPTSNDYSDPNNPYPAVVRIFLIKGQLYNDKFIYESTNLIKQWNMPYASPCLTKYKDRYILTYIDSNSANDGVSFNGIFVGYVEKPEEFAKVNSFIKIKYDDSKLLPWHMSIFQYDNRLFTIIACVERGKRNKIWQMIGEFDEDLAELIIYPTPLTDYNSYRSSAIVDNKGVFILYQATLHERIKGARSVDGRNILVAVKPMQEVLKIIRYGKNY